MSRQQFRDLIGWIRTIVPGAERVFSLWIHDLVFLPWCLWVHTIGSFTRPTMLVIIWLQMASQHFWIHLQIRQLVLYLKICFASCSQFLTHQLCLWCSSTMSLALVTPWKWVVMYKHWLHWQLHYRLREGCYSFDQCHRSLGLGLEATFLRIHSVD